MNRSIESTQMAIRLHIAEAVPLALLALVTVFTRLEDAQLAALLWGATLLVLSVSTTAVLWGSGRPAGWWTWWIGHAVVGAVLGAITLGLSGADSVWLLVWSASAWLVLAGGSSLVQGLRQPKELKIRSDYASSGAGLLLLGALVMIVPPEVYWVMGILGVGLAMMAVYLIIAALSARSGLPRDNSGESEE